MKKKAEQQRKQRLVLLKKKKKKLPPSHQKSSRSILTAGENINPDSESKRGGKTRFWEKEHSGRGAPHWAPAETYPKISEPVGQKSVETIGRLT